MRLDPDQPTFTAHASSAGQPRARRTAADDGGAPILTLSGAIITTGLLAGVYYAFAVAVMPGLKDADDATFVTTMQRINASIVNPAFMLAFLGAPALTAAAAWQWSRRPNGAGRRGARLALLALGLHLAGLGLTAGANVPLNDALAQAGDPAQMSPAHLAEARAAYEQPWTRRHLLRTGVTVAAFGALAAAGLVAARERRTASAEAQRSAPSQAGSASPANGLSRARAASAR